MMAEKKDLTYCGLSFGAVEIVKIIEEEIDRLVKEPLSKDERKRLELVGFVCFLEGIKMGGEGFGEILKDILEKLKPEIEVVEQFCDLMLRLTPTKGES
jgi:hypothetical protein